MIPERFPVERVKDYHTHYIGKYYNGIQFFGTICNLSRNFQVVLYLFDKDGNTLGTELKPTEISREMEYFSRIEKLENILKDMIKEVGPYEFCDIMVKPFEIEFEVDGVTSLFGLIAN